MNTPTPQTDDLAVLRDHVRPLSCGDATGEPATVDQNLVAAFMADLRDGGDRSAIRSALFQPKTIAAFVEAVRRLDDEDRTAKRGPRDVAVTVCAGAEIRMLTGMGRDFEAHGDEPVLEWFRDANGVIRGIVLVGHLSAATKAGMS